jgi:hypothetical protein
MRRPIQLHPDNPHYFLWRDQPTVLITSGEHYGAVLNLDFDHATYLKALAAYGFNLTRTFSGAYCEHIGAFNIRNNTLAPAPGRLICPWARSDVLGYTGGGNRFDLDRWDPAYLDRLRGFLGAASERGVVVELVLFCPFYGDEMWALSPMNAANNVNGIGALPRDQVYTLQDGALTAVQEAMARKLVETVSAFDNVYLEICNEPYAGVVTPEWQARIAEVIVQAEAHLPHRHLIAQNIANGQLKVERPNPHVSILNFHYAKPPETVALNYDLNRVIADDETGFSGSEPDPYRVEGWHFLMAGGGVYDNLDYSFTVGHEDGTADIDAPGGGGRVLHEQLAILVAFFNELDYVRMRPDNAVVDGAPEGATVRALAEEGQTYAVYLNGPRGESIAELALALPGGAYRAEWVNTKTGDVDKAEDLKHAGGTRVLVSPEYVDDIALRVRRSTNRPHGGCKWLTGCHGSCE